MNIKAISAQSYVSSLQGAKAQNPKPNKSGAAQESSTTVSLSTISQQLRSTDGDINMDRVREIRAAIADGTLVINPERIAQGLIDSAAELLS